MENDPVAIRCTVVETVEMTLRFPRPLHPGEATHLRGFFGCAFHENVLLHHHQPDGSLRYQYPKVQFKVVDRTAHLIGFSEGVEIVTRLWAEVDQARIGDEVLPVLEAGLCRRRERLAGCATPLSYRFLTPWLALNQTNHTLYERMDDPESRRALLERTIVGNCLSLSKGFGHRVESRLRADCRDLRAVPARFRGVPMLGFVGTFRLNFEIPRHAGIGKSVSRGFGTVERS